MSGQTMPVRIAPVAALSALLASCATPEPGASTDTSLDPSSTDASDALSPADSDLPLDADDAVEEPDTPVDADAASDGDDAVEEPDTPVDAERLGMAGRLLGRGRLRFPSRHRPDRPGVRFGLRDPRWPLGDWNQRCLVPDSRLRHQRTSTPRVPLMLRPTLMRRAPRSVEITQARTKSHPRRPGHPSRRYGLEVREERPEPSHDAP